MRRRCNIAVRQSKFNIPTQQPQPLSLAHTFPVSAYTNHSRLSTLDHSQKRTLHRIHQRPAPLFKRFKKSSPGRSVARVAFVENIFFRQCTSIASIALRIASILYKFPLSSPLLAFLAFFPHFDHLSRKPRFIKSFVDHSNITYHSCTTALKRHISAQSQYCPLPLYTLSLIWVP